MIACLALVVDESWSMNPLMRATRFNQPTGLLPVPNDAAVGSASRPPIDIALMHYLLIAPLHRSVHQTNVAADRADCLWFNDGARRALHGTRPTVWRGGDIGGAVPFSTMSSIITV